MKSGFDRSSLAGGSGTPMKKQMIMNIGVMAREEEQWL